MSTLLLQFGGPMQSWAIGLRFTVHRTDMEPSFSGVVGMVAAALGRSESDPIDDLAQSMVMGVRVDQPGRLMVDFHTVAGGRTGKGDAKDMALTYRHYLCDALFLVGLEGPSTLLDSVAQALERPATPLFLGRRACPPSAPVFYGHGGGDGLEAALRLTPWLGQLRPESLLRLQLPATAATASLLRTDYPLSFAPGHRAYAPRAVREVWIPTPLPEEDEG